MIVPLTGGQDKSKGWLGLVLGLVRARVGVGVQNPNPLLPPFLSP
jgi:hypothetical protein